MALQQVTKGNWQVTRNCCTSGNCIECHGKTPVGTPMRVVQMDNIDEPSAKMVAKNWAAYDAVAVPMKSAV